MYDFVSAERAGLPETFATNLADKGSRPCMHWHVARQIVVGVENFATLGTSERFLGLSQQFL